MIPNRDEPIGKIRDVAECRSGGSCDQSHMIGVMEFESVVRWHGAGWMIVWFRSHMTGVGNPGWSRSFRYLTVPPF
jgi:hypothetical protein